MNDQNTIKNLVMFHLQRKEDEIKALKIELHKLRKSCSYRPDLDKSVAENEMRANFEKEYMVNVDSKVIVNICCVRTGNCFGRRSLQRISIYKQSLCSLKTGLRVIP